MKSAFRKGSLRAVLVAAALAAAVPVRIPGALAQNLPNLGDESSAVLSPQMERKIGEGFYRELRRDSTFIDDFEVSGYVQELGQRLITAGPEPGIGVEFFVLKDPQINAFAMLGGYIGVNTGLIIASESESETASVLGHEIGHLTQKHIARSVAAGQRSSTVSMIASVLCLLAARSNPQVTSGCLAGAQAASIQSQLAYSRDFEREADRVGLDILRRGGFDVAAMPLFFERLQRSTRILESNAPSYVRSHPLTTERIADVRNRTQDAVFRQRADTPTFHLVRAKLRATMDESIDGTRDAVRFFTTQIEQRTYVEASAAHLGLAYAQLLAKNVAGAQSAFARIANPGSHPMFETLAARIRRAAGDGEGALALLRDASRRHPNSRAIQFEWIEAAQALGKHAEALVLLRDQAQLYRADPKVYELQAKSYAAEGKRLAQHQALGEHYALLGALQPAIEQFQLARCSGEGDFYQLSIIDARIRTLWQSLLNERSDQQGAGRQGSSGGERGRPGIEQGMPTRC
jgi:predicted Zn-dependent protease